MSTIVRELSPAFDRPVRVTYIITTRNRGSYLAESLQNVRSFIAPADELIVVDGMSTDETPEIIEQNRDIVAQYIREPDRSEGHAFNKALYRARGDLIKPLADDDFVYPEAMTRVVELMVSRPDIDVLQCGGEAWEVTDQGSSLWGFRRLNPDEAIDRDRLFWDSHHFLGMIFRRSAAVLVGGVDPCCRPIDGDLFLRFMKSQCCIKYLDIKLYRWYLFPHSGFHRKEEVNRDYASFRVRLSGSATAFGLPLADALRQLGLEDTPHGRAFTELGIYSYKLIQNRAGGILEVLVIPMRILVRTATTLRRWIRSRRSVKEAPTGAPVEPVWTRRLI
jgi:glycosyltransferase involved in cell wall biosynthesis